MRPGDLESGAIGVIGWGEFAKGISHMTVNAWNGAINLPGRIHRALFAQAQLAPLSEDQERVANLFDLEVTQRQQTNATVADYQAPTMEDALLPIPGEPLAKEVKDYVATHPARRSLAYRAAAGMVSVITFVPRMALKGACVIAYLVCAVVKTVFSFITYPFRGAAGEAPAQQTPAAKPEPTPEKKAKMKQHLLDALGTPRERQRFANATTRFAKQPVEV